MENFEKVLVGLDNTEMDHELIQTASFISRLKGTKEIHFTHIIKSAFISKSLLNEFPTLINDAIMERQKALQEKINQYFDQEQINKVRFEVKEGVPSKILMKKIEKDAIDLLILGKKATNLHKETITNSITKKAECSLLIVPQGAARFDMKRILVPVDYSKGSHLALGLAANLVKSDLKGSEILTQNIFSVPTGYHYTGKTFEEFAEIMKQNAIQDYKNFVSDIDVKDANVKNIYTLDKQEDLIGVISKTAQKMEADAIIIGAKVKTASSAFFSGSSAEKLLHHQSNIPVFIIRKKGKNASFFEYLSEI